MTFKTKENLKAMVGGAGMAVMAILCAFIFSTTPQAAVSQPEPPPRDCHFSIVDTGPDRGVILLDECSGNTWWYHNGWSAQRHQYTARPEWHRIPKTTW